MIYITFERGGLKFSNTTDREFAYPTAVQQQNGYYAAQKFLRS
jgi:hypothetical protein